MCVNGTFGLFLTSAAPPTSPAYGNLAKPQRNVGLCGRDGGPPRAHAPTICGMDSSGDATRRSVAGISERPERPRAHRGACGRRSMDRLSRTLEMPIYLGLGGIRRYTYRRWLDSSTLCPRTPHLVQARLAARAPDQPFGSRRSRPAVAFHELGNPRESWAQIPRRRTVHTRVA
jgi:hypothetical protein